MKRVPAPCTYPGCTETTPMLPEFARFYSKWLCYDHSPKPIESEAEECEHEFDASEGGTCLNCGAEGYDYFDADLAVDMEKDGT